MKGIIDDWLKLNGWEQFSLILFVSGPIAMMIASFWSLL